MRTANGDPGRQNPWQLEFPPDHQISGLQALWQGRQAREPVRLDFQAGLPQGAVLPAAEPAQEMCRCQFLINYAARTRLGIKYVRFSEQDVLGEKRERVGLYNPTAAQSR